MLGQVLLLLVFLVLSGFFSSSETALFSISRAKVTHLAKEGKKSFQLIKKMKEDPHSLLSTILIGNNIVNVGASALATAIAIDLFPGKNGVGIATGVMTILILVFGEIIPKSIATRNNVFISKLVIRPIYWLSILFFPVIKILFFIPGISGKMQRHPTVTEEELITFIDVVEEEGEIKPGERELIHKIFQFDDTSASEIMTPRSDMFVIDLSHPLDFRQIIDSGFTRFPVIEGDIDQIIGIMHIKDLFIGKSVQENFKNLKKIMREPYFVPENKKIDSLLHQFKQRKQHMAILIDEHGGVAGLVTLEDVIEEIVGEIVDETDKDEPPRIIKVKQKEWLVPGKADIDYVNKMTKMNIPDSREYDTFSGYVLEKTGIIPKEKENINIGEFVLTVKEMDGNRINSFIVRKKNNN